MLYLFRYLAVLYIGIFLFSISTVKASNESQITSENDEALFFLLPGPIIGFYYFEYQKAFTQEHSINLSVEYANPFYNGSHLTRYWAIYRYKLKDYGRGPLDGFFIAPAVHVAVPFDGSTLIGNAFVYGVYQYVQENRIAWQGFLGIGYGGATKTVEDYKMLYGLSPSIGVSVGYVF